MKEIKLTSGGVAKVHTGDYDCCLDCRHRLERDDEARRQGERPSTF